MPSPLVPRALVPSLPLPLPDPDQPSQTFPSSEASGHLSPPRGLQPWPLEASPAPSLTAPLTAPRGQQNVSHLTLTSSAGSQDPGWSFPPSLAKHRDAPPHPPPQDRPQELKARCWCGPAAPPGLVRVTGWIWRRRGTVCRPGVRVDWMGAGERDRRRNLEARPCVLLSCRGRACESDAERGRVAQTSSSAPAEEGGPRRPTGAPGRAAAAQAAPPFPAGKSRGHMQLRGTGRDPQPCIPGVFRDGSDRCQPLRECGMTL